MAKKARRARSGATTPARPAQSRLATPAAQPVRIARPIRAPERQAPKEVDFAQEYHYVLEDLKRIGIIAGSLLVVLIALALIIG